MLTSVLTLLTTVHVISGFDHNSNPQFKRSQYSADSSYTGDNSHAEGPLYSAESGYPAAPDARPRTHTYTLEADIPELIRYFFDINDDKSVARSQSERELPNQKFKIQITNPDWNSVLETLKNLLRRRNVEGAYTEEGPGTYKSEHVAYPKNYQKNNFEKLLALKARMDSKKRQLNEENE